ncbi:hypothetical protein FC65_GL001625 [Ligilactobacillus acidipiscis DSM 15836]|uniref:Uncharacterized protein n=1 Tax=Ligilactobacillus acidipiscis DSM 15836 TaxID=1423716 RepID=A0ABR5PKC7_9LACO|nr:hypothetical protein [Ligilactobacillus acidipiscis]KRM28723.1 hypothetical protein FC65_GL001625 [Ligilactobacillus acidipiscis DSM 15836]GAW63387.1 hypothetical protein Lacidipiscis_00570 [Ligilactobacillus acidipiscis]GEN19596.1 hypothetical protein LAC02_28770 [Ligilactobacillus acidipiscis]
MTTDEWYTELYAAFQQVGLKCYFNQPSIDEALPLVQIGVHIDNDQSNKTGGALYEIQQQIDLYADPLGMTANEFERLIRKVKYAISSCTNIRSMTATTMIDTSTEKELKRCLFLVTTIL